MEPITEQQIDLFAEQLPSLEQIEGFCDYVHSGERNRLEFAELLDKKAGRKGNDLAVGIGMYILGRDEEAVERLEAAGDCQEKFIYLGRALRRLGRFDEAVKGFQKSLGCGADSLTIAMEKVESFRLASDIEGAEKELKACVNFENVSAEYHYQLGMLAEQQGLYEQAMENYMKAVELMPEHQKALFRLAYRCDLTGDEEAAIDYYKQVVAIAPVYVNALINLAVLYEDRDDFEKAAKCIYKVLEYHPNHRRAIMFKADIESSMTMFIDEEKEKKKDYRDQILQTPISDFELSVRSRNCLRKMNIGTLDDLLNITEAELLSYKNFGETSLREIKVILDAKGLRLGMMLEEKQFAAISSYHPDGDSDADDGVLTMSFDDLQLSVRARRALQNLTVHTVGELIHKTEAELLGCKNFGVTSLNEINKALVGLGLSLRKLE